jgi:hypothetical protein
VRQLLRRLPFVPYACEVVNDALARHLGVGSGVSVLVRMGGNEESVKAQRAAMTELGHAHTVDSGVWTSLRAAEPEGADVIRLSRLPSEIGMTWSDAQTIATACGGNAFVHATPARGVVRCILPRGDATSRARLRETLAAPTTATRIGERLDRELWPLLWTASTGDGLAARIRSTFDPQAILNPGLFGAPA